MAGLPGTTSSRAEEERASAKAVVVLAGRDAVALRELLEKQFAAEPAEIVTADSILEAVLISGGGPSEGDERSPEAKLVVAGISQELDQVEAAVRSLRKVYPQARIVLVCEPEDEVVCRKAKGWGATDYLILPVDEGSLKRSCTLSPLPVTHRAPAVAPGMANRMAGVEEEVAAQLPMPVPAALHAPADLLRKVVELQANATAANADGTPPKLPIRAALQSRPNSHEMDISLPGLPLMVQTALLTDLLNGRADFADRIVATLQSYVKWGGVLRFVAAVPGEQPAEAASASTLREIVALPDQPPFGALMLEPRSADVSWPPAGAAAALSQGAHWMAAILSISRRYEQLRSLAITDELSGAYNRRYFNKFMQGLLERARVNRFRVTLLLFDIDDFKKYNDTFGHASGDAIIRELIKLLRLCTRPDDLVARLGGDEFAVVYWDHEAPRQPNSEHPKDMLAATERFRKAIKNHAWPEICKIQGEVSISGGLATFPWDADTLESLMARADQALLRAKAGGKNVILLHGADGFPCEEKTEEK